MVGVGLNGLAWIALGIAVATRRRGARVPGSRAESLAESLAAKDSTMAGVASVDGQPVAPQR